MMMSRIPTISSLFVLFVLVFLSALLLQFYLPWWIVVVTGFMAGLLSTRAPWQNFLIVFSAIALLWLSASAVITLKESSVLLPRMAGLFQLPKPWMVFVLTALVGALPASLAALGSSWLTDRPERTEEPTTEEPT